MSENFEPTSPTSTSDSGPILVTGGTGRLGRLVVRALLNLQLPVRMTVRGRAGAVPPHPNLEAVEADLRHPGSMARAARGCAAVVHLASAMSDRLWPMMREDLAGTWGLLEGWERGPFIYASSASAATARGLWRSRYGLGKRLCEALVLGRGKTKGTAMALRLPHLFGAGAWREGGLLDTLARHVRRNGPFGLPEAWADSDRAPRIAWLDIEDAAAAICSSLARPRSGCYSVTPNLAPWPALIDLVGRATGQSRAIVYRRGARPPPWLIDSGPAPGGAPELPNDRNRDLVAAIGSPGVP